MWFRQGQPLDPDALRVSIKNRMRRTFRSPDKETDENNGKLSSSNNNTKWSNKTEQHQQQQLDDQVNKKILPPASSSSVVSGIPTPIQSVQRSASGKKLHKGSSGVGVIGSYAGSGSTGSVTDYKDKTLLTDRKFKNNRVLKSLSKGKISADNAVVGNELSKIGRTTNRKISAPPILDVIKSAQQQQKQKDSLSMATSTDGPNKGKKHVRSHSNLNLNALLRYKLTNKKLSSADFERIRRKSISSDSGIVGKNKSISLDETDDATETTDSKNINDDEIIATIQPNDCDQNDLVLSKYGDCSSSGGGGGGCSVSGDVDVDVDDEEEVFLSAGEDLPSPQTSVDVIVSKKSPSLSARVAARFAEHTSSGRNKKSKQKKRRNSKGSVLSERPTSTSVQRQLSDRRPDGNNSYHQTQNPNDYQTQNLVDGGSSIGGVGTGISGSAGGGGSSAGGVNAIGGFGGSDLNTPDAEPENRDSSQSKSAPVSVNRSESYKERLSHRRNRNSRRKTSDPSLSKTNDEQIELGISNANFTASSSSSLSSSLDSPSTSLEAVGAPPTGGQGTVLNNHHHHNNHHQNHHNHHHHHHTAARQWVDSDDEACDLEVDWCSNVAADMLLQLSKHEKERQEIINEIYQTERNHVRTLKLLEGVFLKPLQESGAIHHDLLSLLFPPALINLKEHHSSFEQQLKQRRIEHRSVVPAIGDLLLSMFDGRSGEELKEHAAHFCARQQIALEALREKRRKDDNLQRLLAIAESHKACRRLQLKDLLPTALQRLTKYPLLFESLYTITQKVDPDNNVESTAIRKALELSKRILDHVNQAVRCAEDTHKLQTIQKKLDRANYDKEAAHEFKNLDLTMHKLLHDGPLMSKKNPGVQIHGLLFENIMVLLQRLDDKYILKYHTCTVAGSGDGGKSIEGRFNPISKINLILVRNSAVDKNIFFLINTSSSQMMELTAPSSSECKTWVKHISDAAEAFKTRTKGNHDQASTDDASSLLSATNTTPSTAATTVSTNPATTPTNVTNNQPSATSISNSSTKESLESTPEKEINISSNNNNNYNSNNNKNNNSQDHKDRYGSESQQQQDQHNYHKSSSRTRRKTLNSENENDQDDQNLDGKKKRIASGGDYSDDNDNDNDNDDDNVHDEYQNDDGDDDDDEDNDNDFSNNKNKKRGVRKRFEYSNNSNNTRTITQQSSLVAPSEVHISVSPSLTAEPVLTPNERLRRLDESIRMTLAEKQRVVCDMFKVPNEHFTAIADIVSQPEAPKDPSDIVLAAFAQVQTLTETLNEYIRVSTHQEISAVSTSLCDECHNKNNVQLSPQHHHNNIIPQIASPLQPQRAAPQIPVRQSLSSSQNDNKDDSNIPILSTTTTTKYADIVRNNNIGATGHPPPSPTSQLPIDPILDDDGYCEIDELRLPTVLTSTNNNNINSSTTTISTGGLILSTSPPSSAQTTSITNATTISSNSNSSSLSSPVSSAAASAPVSIDNKTAELKRQSTISADSIPEETEHEIHAELIASKITPTSVTTTENNEQPQQNNNNDNNDNNENTAVDGKNDEKIEDRGDNNYNDDDDEIVGHMDINETYVTQQIPNTTTTTTTKASISIVAASVPVTTTNTIDDRPNVSSLNQCVETTCSANRLAHATSLAPAVPCHLISNIITALNLQISQLLPKLNERDIEREKLRKENQHLRELLNSMHDRERVSNERESPNHAFDLTNSKNVSHRQMTISSTEASSTTTATTVAAPSTDQN